MSVRLIAITKPVAEEFGDNASPEDLIGYTARVSNPTNQLNFETSERLLRYCMKKKHWSIFTMANVVLEIKTTRDIGRQILRHSSLQPQEFCVAEGTFITTERGKKGSSQKVPIEKLYKRFLTKQYWDKSNNLIRVFDRKTNLLTQAKIKEIFETGIKPVYKIVVEGGYQLECTKEHKILTFDGWKPLSDISVEGDFIGTNGVPNFGKDQSEESRQQMRKSARKGADSNLYKSENYTSETMDWRKKVAQVCKGFHLSLLVKQNFRCAISGTPITKETSEVGHILPVYARPDLAFEESNLQVLSKEEHKKKSISENVQSRTTSRFKKIQSIEFVGEKQTYDIEVEHCEHNYIANGIITHNSQRYQEVDVDNFVYREARLQDPKNRQASHETDDEDLQVGWRIWQEKVASVSSKAYQWAIENGIAKEQARAVLPEGLTPSVMYFNGTLRSWVHYVDVRSQNDTQKEHRLIALEVKSVLLEQFPFLKDYWSEHNE